MSKSLLLRWAACRCRELRSHIVFLTRADEQDQTAYFAFQSLIPALLHRLWQLHPSRSRRGARRRSSTHDTASRDAEASAEWLSDPSSLSLPRQLTTDPSPLLILNAICPAVHFQRTAAVQVEATSLFLTVPAANGRSTSPSRSPPRPSASPPPAPAKAAPAAPAKKDVPAGAVLSVMSQLLSHAHALSSDAEQAGVDGKRAGTAVLVDAAQWLDSASEELLLKLSEQLSDVRFIFAGLHSGQVGDEKGVAAGSAGSNTSLRKRLTVIHQPVPDAPIPDPVTTSQSAPVPSSAPVTPVPFWLAAKKTIIHQTYLVPLHPFSVSDLALLVKAELDCQHVDPSVTRLPVGAVGRHTSLRSGDAASAAQGQLVQLTVEAETAIDESGPCEVARPEQSAFGAGERAERANGEAQSQQQC